MLFAMIQPRKHSVTHISPTTGSPPHSYLKDLEAFDKLDHPAATVSQCP